MDTYSDIGRERFERKRNVIYAEGVSSSFVRWWIRFSLPRRKECIMTRDGREIDIRCEMKEYLLYLMSKYFSRVIIHRRSFLVFFFFFLYIYIFKQRRIVRIIGHSLCRRDTREFCVFYSNLRRSRSKCMKASETREERENASAISIVWFYSCVTECSGRDEEIIYISRAICNVFRSLHEKSYYLLYVSKRFCLLVKKS